jgi:hypothetical protein
MSAGQITQGRRIYPEADGKLHFTQPGDYGKTADGEWRTRLPNWTDDLIREWYGGMGDVPVDFSVGTRNHTKTEHEDGTLTLSPSYLWGADYGMGPKAAWHGYLEHGVWREC